MFQRVIMLFLLIIFQMDTYAQCSMCKETVKNQVENGTMSIDGINKGIIYLMSIPYFLILMVGFVLYRNYKKQNSLSNKA